MTSGGNISGPFPCRQRLFLGGEGGDGFTESSGNAHHLHPPGGHTGKPFPGLPPGFPLEACDVHGGKAHKRDNPEVSSAHGATLTWPLSSL